MNKAKVPSAKPCDTPGKMFVPEVAVIEFDCPEHGKHSWVSFEENDMSDKVMRWESWSQYMWTCGSSKIGISQARVMIDNILKAHPEAVVVSNYKGWEKK